MKAEVTTLALLAIPLVLLFAIASGHRFYSRYGDLCVSECAQNGKSYYWCWTGSRWSWEYCSPQMNVSIYNKKCRADHPCLKHSQSYYWCYLDAADNWDYCGQVLENFNIISSTYGHYCIDNCAKKGYDYYWCNTGKGWDYCSPEVGLDYKGNRCDYGTHETGYCGKHGYSYYWCYINGGSSYGYCSIEGDGYLIAYNGFRCSTRCLHNKYGYKCSISDGSLSACSPFQGIDSHGRPCISECAKSGGGAYLCKFNNTTYDEYDYCGIESLDTAAHCASGLSAAITTLDDQCEIIRNVIDHGNNLEMTWTMENNSHILNYTSTNCPDRRAGIAAIAQLEDIDRQPGTIVTLGNVRIDLQGFVNRNNHRFANIQVQINRPRKNAQDSTTIAVALVELANIPIRYVRDALIRSLTDCSPRQCWLQSQKWSISDVFNQDLKFPPLSSGRANL